MSERKKAGLRNRCERDDSSFFFRLVRLLPCFLFTTTSGPEPVGSREQSISADCRFYRFPRVGGSVRAGEVGGVLDRSANE